MISDCVYLAILKNITVRLASRSCDVTFWEQTGNCSRRPSELLKYFVIWSPVHFSFRFTPLKQESSQKRWWNLLFLNWTNICLTLWLLLVMNKRNPMTFSPWTAFRLKPLLHKWKYSVYGIREDTCGWTLQDSTVSTCIALFRPISAFIMWKRLLLGHKWTKLRFVVCTWLTWDALLAILKWVWFFLLVWRLWIKCL